MLTEVQFPHCEVFRCSYNKINNITSCGNNYTLNSVIRDKWGRSDALIGTDWGAMPKGNDEAAAAQALNSGVDLEMVSFNTRARANIVSDQKS